MPRTLYVSDLDGTLLDREGCISQFTLQIIHRMNEEGLLFTIATARSLQSSNDLLWYLGLRLPAILTNGTAIYDSASERYLSVRPLEPEILGKILWTVESFDITAFLYALRGERMHIYYRQLRQEWDRIYHANRVERYEGRVFQSGDMAGVARDNAPIWVVACGPWETLLQIQRQLERVPGVCCEIYSDVYNNFYYIDIFPAGSSKGVGILELQRITGAEEIVAFGDNFSDLSMLLVADRSYAPRGAIAAAKNIASDVLDYAHRDCVAHFLAAEFGWEHGE